MIKKIFFTFLTVTILSLLSFFIMSYSMNKSTEKNLLEDDLKIEITDIEYLMDTIDKDDFYNYLYNYDKNNNVRINIYDNNYINIYDSRNFVELVTKFDTDLIKKIDETGYASDSKYKFSINKDIMYVVKKVDFYGQAAYLRISIPIFVSSNSILLQSLLVSFILGTAISLIVTNIYNKKYILPIQKLTKNINNLGNSGYKDDIDISNVDEIGDLQMELKELSNNVRFIIDKYDRRKGQLESILSSLNAGLIAIDNDGVILFHNINFSNMFKLSSNLINRDIFENIYDKQLIELIEESKRVEYIESVRIEQSNGTIFDYKALSIMNSSIRIGTLILVEDVTKLAHLENVRKDFVSNVTHELKTPLTSIRGFSETLRSIDPKDVDARNRFLSIIEEETDRLTYLINDILVLSEVENTKDLDNEEVNLNQLVKEVMNIFSINKEEDVDLEFRADNEYTIIANEMRVRQVINNLLSNSIKYTEEGSIKLSISSNNENVIFEIKDTGIGIPKQHLKRIFERFYRVDSDRSRKTGGTGLGLSIVKNIAEKYNWKIDMESEVGIGTTISIHFPRNIILK